MEYVLSRKRGGWREGYYATASDLGIVEFTKWLERHGGGRPDWEGGEPSATELLPLETLFSPYEQHAKNCPICKEVQVSPLPGSDCGFKFWDQMVIKSGT